MAKTKANPMSVLTNGLWNENPIFRLVLGTCPTLAVTTSATNGLGMGLASTCVLIGSNIVISLLRKVIPNKVRIPAYITIIAGFVTIIQLLLKAYIPSLDKALGIYIPLIVVNCIILARAEAFAAKNTVGRSALDGLGMGLGFAFALTLIGATRELIGAGSIFGQMLFSENFQPALIMILPPGGFLSFGLLIALMNKLNLLKVDISHGTPCGSCESTDACAPETDSSTTSPTINKTVKRPSDAAREAALNAAKLLKAKQTSAEKTGTETNAPAKAGAETNTAVKSGVKANTSAKPAVDTKATAKPTVKTNATVQTRQSNVSVKPTVNTNMPSQTCQSATPAEALEANTANEAKQNSTASESNLVHTAEAKQSTNEKGADSK